MSVLVRLCSVIFTLRETLLLQDRMQRYEESKKLICLKVRAGY